MTRWTVLVVLASLLGTAAAAPKRNPKKLAAAVKLLASPSTWCRGARQLAKLKDPEGLIPLERALHSGVEADHSCLIDAIMALKPERHLKSFLTAADVEHRLAGLSLAIVWGKDEHLPLVEKAILSDPSPEVRTAALSTLRQSHRTKAWRAVNIRLLDVEDATVRGAIVDSIAVDPRDELADALRARLKKETDPDVKKQIEAALAPVHE